MIPKECKRLAEVDFPIAVVSKHSAREKSIRHGHPSTLHLWWARRPLAACRPKNEDLRKALLDFIGDFSNWDNSSHPVYLEVSRGLVKAAHLPAGRQVPYQPPLVVDPFAGGGSIPLEALRIGCDAFASDLNPVACLILKVMLEDIPRHGPELAEELRRVGKEIKEKAEKELAEFYPCLPAGRPKNPEDATPNKYYAYVLRCCDGSLYKGHTDNLSRRFKQHCDGLVEWTKPRLPVDLIHWDEYETQGEALEREKWLKSGVGREWLAQQFPKERPIAYLWARTVKCESPNCGAEIPLIRSFWILKDKRKRALNYQVKHANKGHPFLEFSIFEPKKESDVHGPTVSRAKATCLCCNSVLHPDRVRSQLTEQNGGTDVIFDKNGKRIGGATLLAVITVKPDRNGRFCRLANEKDYKSVYEAQKKLEELCKKNPFNGLSPDPDEPTPEGGGSGAGRAFSVRKYGISRWGNLFNARQKLSLSMLASAIREAVSRESIPAIKAVACALDIFARSCNSNARLRPDGSVAPAFGMHTLPITWTFPETIPWGRRSEQFEGAINTVIKIISNRILSTGVKGQVEQEDACQSPLPDESAAIWFTDPPYYDAIPYSDLSDFFLIWLRRSLPSTIFKEQQFESNNCLSPKLFEIVQDEIRLSAKGHPKDRTFFEERMAEAFSEGQRITSNDGIGSVVFAHKTTEGWEALLSGMIKGGWTITGSWPIATEAASRLRARDSAALATSVHLVCRPRPDDAGIGDWAEVLRELPQRVGDWIERLQSEGVRGADLVFACIGPALEIYSRYSKVEDAEGNEIPLGGDPEAAEPYKRGFLAYVWETVGRLALEQVLGTAEAKARNGAAGAVEEDARLTALFLWTLQSTNNQDEKTTEKVSEDGDDLSAEQAGDEEAPKKRSKGFSLVFDVVRRFAQPLGIKLPDWEGRIIKTEKGVVRLLPVSERAKQLFGEDGATDVADRLEQDEKTSPQMLLFPEAAAVPKIKSKGRRQRADVSDEALQTRREATTLDRVHAAMLLQAAGRANALRALIKAEQQRSPDFLRLANALSALYPRDSEEKRLIDAMLLAVPR